MDENMMIRRGRGMIDLIAGKTPTFDGWTADPTDAADVTDGDITTFCTTGSKVLGAGYQYCYMTWDLGALYDVVVGLVSAINKTAGSAYIFIEFYDGATWIKIRNAAIVDTVVQPSASYSARCSQIRLGLTASAAATITPNIREFNVWRL